MSVDRRTVLVGLLAPPWAAGASWAEFRGDGAGALPEGSQLPQRWSRTESLAWSVRLRGYGQSSPVARDGRVFLTAVDGANKESVLVSARDLATGDLLWVHSEQPAQPGKVSDMVSRAAPTPAVDEGAVYAFFETGNVLCLDHGGKARWSRRLTDEFGQFEGRHGIGSSLRLCSSGLLALVAHDGPSYLICLSRDSGETVWKADRDPGISWSTPVLAQHGGRELVLVSCGDRVEAYDTASGAPLWTLRGLDGAFVASPTPVPGGAIIGSSSKGQTVGVRFGSTPSEPPEVAWRATEAASYFSSPLLHGGRAYMVNKAGVAFCLQAESGHEIWHERLAGSCWASSVASDDHLYFFGVDGLVEVFRAGDRPHRVAKNSLEEGSRLYGVAVAEQALLLRYGRRLACVRAS